MCRRIGCTVTAWSSTLCFKVLHLRLDPIGDPTGMNVTMHLRHFIATAIALLFLYCSLPDQVEPVEWNMHLEVPIIDRHLTLGDVVPGNSFAGLALDLGDSGVMEDTISVSRSDTLQYRIDKTIGTTDTCVVTKTAGPQTLKGAPSVEVRFSLGKDLPDHFFDGIPVPVPVQLSQQQEKDLPGIHLVTVDESSSPLLVTVINQASRADLNDIVIFIFSAADTIGSIYVPVLAAQSSSVMPLALAGRSFRNAVTVTATATIPSGSVVCRNDGLHIGFTLAGQVVAEAMITDSLIEYSDVFHGKFSLTDSMRIGSIDIDHSSFSCAITNPSSFRIAVTGILEDAWHLDRVEQQYIATEHHAGTAVDSSAFAGRLFTDTLFAAPGNAVELVSVPTVPMRVFPVWDGESGKSCINYQFRIRTLPEGRIVRFSKYDVFTVKVFPACFPFIRLSGEFTNGMDRSFFAERKVGFEWKPSITDSLKKSIRFKSVAISLDLETGLTPGSSLDSLAVRIGIDPAGNRAKTASPTIVEKMLAGIEPGVHFTTALDVTDLLNAWPDSMAFTTCFSMPPGTKLTIHSSAEALSSIGIAMTLNWSVRMPFSWAVDDTIRTELDTTSFSLKNEQLEWVRRLRQPSVRILLNTENRTNLHFILYAIGAAAAFKTELQEFPASSVGAGDLKGRIGENLFSLFGDEGLHLKPRGTRTEAVMNLDERGIGALLDDDKCSVRWFLVIPAGKNDALLASDYLDLKVTGIIEGIGDADSLFRFN